MIMFAPIVIPTLNRYEHLVRCVESLKRNSLAKDTEIYISLDYPPNQKYVEGHEKIKEYLQNDLKDGFKEIHIFFQETNLGGIGNSNFLRNEVYKKFNCHIYTEDDNEFSPNFLEYANKGLEIYKDDNDVVAICGCRKGEKDWGDNGNVKKVQNFNAWGYATWNDKIEECNQWICRSNFLKLLKDKRFCDYLYSESYELFYALIEFFLASPSDYKSVYIDEKGEFTKIDYAKAIYILATNKCVIMPRKTKVRNWGFDGSGANCVRVKSFNPENIDIDRNSTFDYCFESQDKESINEVEVYKDTSYKKLAKRARFYRFIMCTFGFWLARKMNNVSYLLKTFSKKIRNR